MLEVRLVKGMAARGDVAQPDPAAQSQRCGHCGKQYSRPDHLKRHIQSHNNERTHRCKICSCAFNRKDLLDRHQVIHSRFDTTAPPPDEGRRAVKACESCVSAKSKCWGGQPCQRCRQRGIGCYFFDPQMNTLNVESRGSLGLNTMIRGRSNVPNFPGHQDLEEITFDPSSNQLLTPSALESSLSSAWDDYSMLIDTSAFADVDAIFTSPIAVSPQDLSDNGEAQHVTDAASSKSKHNTQVTTDFPGLDALHPDSGQGEVSMLAASGAVSGFEAFQRTPIHYNPASSESMFLDESLELADAEAQILRSPLIEEALRRRMPHGVGHRCENHVRDSVLFLVQSQSTPPVRFLSFPSAESLDGLLQRFLHQHMTSSCSFIHVPSFDLRTCRTELLSAMIASAATQFNHAQIARMGLVLQERIRVAVQKAFNGDGSLARTLDMIQASILWIETGVWSGVGRLMEVAESASNNVPTMLRHAAVYRHRLRRGGEVVLESDEGDTLQRKWLRWAELESFKRCVFRGFVSDIQSSIANLRSPCFYIADANIPLPAAQDLWDATSAVEWKQRFLRKQESTPDFNVTPISMLEIINDPVLLTSTGNIYDINLSAFVALHSLWIQISSLLDMRALLRMSSRREGFGGHELLSINAQRKDLYLRLQQLKRVASHLQVLTTEMSITAEFLSEAPYASPTDIQTIAGRFGEEESRAILPHFQQWYLESDYRYAIWHAGQVLRAAQDMEADTVYGVHAVFIYHACLTLLIATVMAKLAPDTLNFQTPPAHMVVLNGDRTAEVEDFLLTGLGTPVLKYRSQWEPLAKTNIIPFVMKDIFESNGRGQSLSRLPAKLLTLVQDLSNLGQHELLLQQ